MKHTIHKNGNRVILTVEKEQFGDRARQLRDMMTRTLFAEIANGSHAPWGDDLGDAYQVETISVAMAEALAEKLREWMEEVK